MLRRRHITLLLFFAPIGLDAETVSVDGFDVDFGTRLHDGCSFVASPTDFCDRHFVESYEQALLSRKADFNDNMIVVKIDSRPEYAQQTLVAISPSTKTVYPLPFDFFSSSFSKGNRHRNGRATYSLSDNSLCIDGGVMAYKSVQEGHLCWQFVGGQFTGEITPYTYPDR